MNVSLMHCRALDRITRLQQQLEEAQLGSRAEAAGGERSSVKAMAHQVSDQVNKVWGQLDLLTASDGCCKLCVHKSKLSNALLLYMMSCTDLTIVETDVGCDSAHTAMMQLLRHSRPRPFLDILMLSLIH